MNDQHATVAELRTMVRTFVDGRDWSKFHTPKNLVMALAIEAAELMEHFQWLTTDEALALKQDPNSLAAVAEELADVLCYGLALANELQIDVASTMAAKMKKNEAKYPAERFQGKYR